MEMAPQALRLDAQEAPQALRLAEQELAQRDWTRIRFGIAIGILAAGIGTATTVINLLTQFEGIGELERVTPGQSILFGTAGGISGFLVGGPAAYWLYGVRPTFSRQGRRARRLWVWLLLAVVYVLVYAFFTGGFFLPSAQYFFLFLSSVISVPNVVGRFFDLFSVSWVIFGVLNAFKLLYTSAIGGVLFGPCAWGVDRFSTSSKSAVSKYGPIAFASAIALMVVGFSAYAPKELLAQLGP